MFAASLLTLTFALPMPAQMPQPEAPHASADAGKSAPQRNAQEWERWQASSVDRSYKLKYAQSPQDANEILTAMRNMLTPQTKIFLAPSANVIVVHAPEDEQARVVKLLAVLDEPHARYRLTYTLTELDGTRKVGVQHFSMVLIPGQRTIMKQGSRIPLVTAAGAGERTPAYTYIEIGMNFESTLTATPGGGILRSKVEQSSVAPDSMAANGGNPVIRQTLFEGTMTLTDGKPLEIGSLDVPASTHRFDIEALLEAAN